MRRVSKRAGEWSDSHEWAAMWAPRVGSVRRAGWRPTRQYREARKSSSENLPPRTKSVWLRWMVWIACRTPWEYSMRPMLVIEPPMKRSTCPHTQRWEDETEMKGEGEGEMEDGVG